MKAFECAHRLDFKQEELGEDEAKKEFQEKPMKIQFSSPLSGKAKVWYDNLKVREKSSCLTLIKHFKTYYQLIPRDTRARLFDLKMKLAESK